MWNEGYISEVDYVHGYFGQLAPAWLKLALLSRGLAHTVGDAPSYLELGFGQGLTLAVNAAVSAGRFYGVDFNPAQVANARELADASGKTVDLFEQSFEEFAARDDLPEFDIIALHGVWSWVSDATRDTIIRIARDRLRAGGMLYISYNTLPGWSPAMPLRHLLHEYGKRGAAGGLLSRVDEAIGFVETVIGADARYFTENAGLAGRLATIRQQNRHYVSHEYFNREWMPMSFAQVADMLAGAKLSYAGSANLIDNLDGISVPAAAVPILDKLGDETLRQLTRDYFVNQQFRRDIFVKGVRHLPRAAAVTRIRQQGFWRIGEECPSSVSTAAGTAELRADIYRPLAEAIGELGAGPITVDAISRASSCVGLTIEQIWEAVLILSGIGYLAPAVDRAPHDPEMTASRLLNAEIIDKARYSDQMQYLAAPRIGGALPADRIEQLFLQASIDAAEDPVAFVASVLAAQGDLLLSEGAPITDPGQTAALLSDRLTKFNAAKRPLLESLGAI